MVSERIGRWAAKAAAGFCLLFAAFQAALALGAPFGQIAWGGQSAVLPASLRMASAGAAAFLVLAAAMMAGRAGLWGRRWPPLIFRAFNGLLCLQLALNTAANLASQTAAERFGMGSATAIGLALCVAAIHPEVSLTWL